MSETATFRLHVNGTERVVEGAWVGESLLYVLRERLGLPGAKNACEQGECGSCSVLLDGTLVCACLVLGASAAEREVVTVEGLPNGAFLEVEVEGGGSRLVAFDVLGSGLGERVLVATGSVAAAHFPTPHPPLDALVIGSIDES